MPPVSVLLGRETVSMLISVCSSKPHTYPRAGIRLLCVKLKLTSISASVVPMCPAWNWSSVPTETVAGSIPPLTSETVQVCSLIKAQQNDRKRGGKLASEHDWQPSLISASLSPLSFKIPVNFYERYNSFFSPSPSVFEALYLVLWLAHIKDRFCA